MIKNLANTGTSREHFEVPLIINCNLNCKQSYILILTVLHNLSRYDYYFLIRDLSNGIRYFIQQIKISKNSLTRKTIFRWINLKRNELPSIVKFYNEVYNEFIGENIPYSAFRTLKMVSLVSKPQKYFI